MQIINESTVVVFTYEELKEALEKPNNYKYIYFGANITLTNGITISNTKENVIIDGTYNGVIYTLEDKKSASSSDTININSNFIKNVTVQNLNIIGYNYYGVIYVPESNNYANTIVEYNNITYKGPQISFHPSGLTRFINSNITIEDSYATGNEVAEANKVEIGKITTITHKSTGNSSFWFRNSNPSLTILAGATVNFTSKNRELFYGPTNLTLTLEKNATFNIKTKNGMAYGTFGTGTTNIYESATLKISQTTKNSNYATWYSYGPITIDQGSLVIINNFSNISSSNYNISFQNKDCSLTLKNPKEIVLYNDIANIINTTSSIPFDFEFNRLNLFETPIKIEEAISENTLPTYSWYKKDPSIIKGTFDSKTVTITSNNYTSEELKELPDLTNFIFQNKKIMSIGSFPINLNPITDQDTTISGKTEAFASLLIQYDDKNMISVADKDGNFTSEIGTTLPIGTIIKVTAKKENYPIYHTKIVEIVYPGEINIISATEKISFNLTPIKTSPIICPRLTPLTVTVTDFRINKTNWKIYASIDNDPISKTGEILKDSLIFIDNGENITTLSNAPTLVYTNNDNTNDETIVTWDDDKGILLKITNPLINNMEYETTINWTLEE